MCDAVQRMVITNVELVKLNVNNSSCADEVGVRGQSDFVLLMKVYGCQ
jgi:hypothetical protein